MKAQIMVKGECCLWAWEMDVSEGEIASMRADGLPVLMVEHEEDATEEEAAMVFAALGDRHE